MYSSRIQMEFMDIKNPPITTEKYFIVSWKILMGLLANNH
jgi:hypothetical protein